jgi:hypothetical protein
LPETQFVERVEHRLHRARHSLALARGLIG